MRCAICGIEIDSVDEAIAQGCYPNFHDGSQLHDAVCHGCTKRLRPEGAVLEMEMKNEYRRNEDPVAGWGKGIRSRGGTAE